MGLNIPFKSKPALRISALLMSAALLAGCAAPSGPDAINDPFEPANRGIHAFNKGVDRALVGPASKGVGIVPEPVRRGIDNVADTLALLGRLRERRERQQDLRLYYLSNMPEPYARVLEQRHDFLQWFDGGMFSADVKMIKPQPDIFALLQSRYALAPAHTVFIDDLPANVDAARTHGWHAIHFESASQLEPQLAAHID